MGSRPYVDVVQISDLHVTDAPGAKGALGQDSDAGLSAVLRAITAGPRPDMVVASGDLADKGTAAAYERLADSLARLDLPVHCLAGNHDHHDPLVSTMPRSSVRVDGSVVAGEWLFVFVDSNAHGRERSPDGFWRDRADRYLSAEHGALTPEEHGRVDATLRTSDAPHAFLWVHHPPVAPDGAETAEAYVGQLRGLVRSHPGVRAIACGHFHTAYDGVLDGRPVFVAPSTSLNFDAGAGTYVAPGYRRLRLHDDGTVTSTVHFLDDEFPGARERRAPPSLIELMLGRITLDELRSLTDEQYLARYGCPRVARP
jgi:Icc protein